MTNPEKIKICNNFIIFADIVFTVLLLTDIEEIKSHEIQVI